MGANVHNYEFAPNFKQVGIHTWKDAVEWNHGDPHRRTFIAMGGFNARDGELLSFDEPTPLETPILT
eukprot:2861101-Pyramimonas_sp.AAC.1